MSGKIRFERTPGGGRKVRVPYRGRDVLVHGLLNKGTAFTREEREALGLRGLLPQHVTTLDEQVRRSVEHITRKEEPLERYIGMMAQQERNEVLFYRILLDHIEQMMPVVYTPTVGEACRQYSHIFRRGRGLWITPEDRGSIADILRNVNVSEDHLRLIVVTDNERILGLGDQGAGGIGIPIGKLALYTAAAGIHPSHTLPISLDVGTDNQELLNDDLYVGYRAPRLRGEAYDSLVAEFAHAVKEVFPRALLQWEDFKKANAFALLERYRKSLPSFNDDIQGTAAVALAALVAACRVKGESLEQQRVVILGAGAAGVGIGLQLRDAFARVGLKDDALVRAVAVIDSQGLLVEEREIEDAYKRQFAWPKDLARACGLSGSAQLKDVVDALKPTALIGTSGQPGAFSQEIVRTMAKHTERPVIFPFSNPTSKSEATPADLYAWTDGKALVATGSPFEPTEYAGKTLHTSQGNNVYVFPGVGLGAIVSEATEVTDAMFTAAAHAVGESTDASLLERGLLLPSLTRLREVTRRIAIEVCQVARDSGVGRKLSDSDIERAVDDEMWDPQYPILVPV